MIRDAAYRIVGRRDFPALWRREPFDREAAIDHAIERLGEIGALAALAARRDDYLARNLDTIDRFFAELSRREAVRGRDYDGLEAELADLARSKEWRWRGAGYYGEGVTRDEVLQRRDRAREELEELIERAEAELASLLQEELSPLVTRYSALKASAGKVDFLDLLLDARRLVSDHEDVRAELSRRFTHLFVDEFQDTDPLQAEILLRLAADRVEPHREDKPSAYLDATIAPGKLFLVGDPKQSIYRFRRADVALYETVKQRLVASGARLVYLTTSFRGSPAIQAAVNLAFQPVMRGGPEGSQASYVPLERYREGYDDQPALVVLPAPKPYADWGKISNYRINESLPDAVGAFVAWLIEQSGYRVTERDTRGGEESRVPLGARHICLLFKRFQSFGEDMTRAYVRALEARRIPHVLVGGRSFHDREEVQAVRSAFTAIEWPDDELSVYATLRGPFFALGDDALLAYRAAIGGNRALGTLHPLHRPFAGKDDAPASIREVDEALSVLAKLHVTRNHRPIADTLAALLASTRAHAGIAIWPTGEQALANVLRVMDLARRFESSGATSFRAFAERLDEDADSGQAGEAPVVEEGTEGVRIMTVHRAKGLEFPVVILADPTAPATLSQPTRFIDNDRALWAEPIAGCVPQDLLDHREEVLARDQDEAVRLLYVAATRARDLLVVPSTGDEPIEGWLAPLYTVLHPPGELRRSAVPAPNCPAFGGDSVLERPADARRGAGASVAPGLHHVPGVPPFVWWDPRALDLGREPEGGVRQQRILTADEAPALVIAGEGEEQHRAWVEARRDALAAGSAASTPIRTVTELAEAAGELGAAPPIPVPVERTSVSRAKRPGGKRFGVLVHASLAEVHLSATPEEAASVVRAQARLIGATADEIAAAESAVVAALAHPILRRAAASAQDGGCRRETPVQLMREDGALIEGVVDLAFREGELWVVVDYKTDAELEGRMDKYRAQIALYAEAIRAATGLRAEGVLLSV